MAIIISMGWGVYVLEPGVLVPGVSREAKKEEMTGRFYSAISMVNRDVGVLVGRGVK